MSRGGQITNVSQDFFINDIPMDRYNSEAFTFTRGPNAILFGLGDPGGGFSYAAKRAKYRTATTVELRTDSRDSFRTSVDHNQVIKKDRLAVRYAGLYENSNGFLTPSPRSAQKNWS